MAEEEGTKKTSEIAKQFQGLPMADLIAGPLTAVCDAQLKLAAATINYIDAVGFEDSKTRLIEFDLDRPAETPNGYEKVNTHVQAPLLGLVPIPSLLVENVDIDFQMEVSATDTTQTKSSSELSSKTEGSFKIPFVGSVKVDVQGKVGSSRENTRTTNQSAKYQVHVTACQQRPTEGMSRLMDIMAQCTAALPNTSVK